MLLIYLTYFNKKPRIKRGYKYYGKSKKFISLPPIQYRKALLVSSLCRGQIL